eukprot:jgi/Ulvmu1/3715/UM170_0021.1
MAAEVPFARPWRNVERLPPAASAGEPRSHRLASIKGDAEKLSVVGHTANRFSMVISRHECSYTGVFDRALQTVPAEVVLGAKVVSRGVEHGHICTAVILVLSAHQGKHKSPQAPIHNEGHHEVSIYECSAAAQASLQGPVAAANCTDSTRALQQQHGPITALPLALQEHIAAEINHFLELLRGDFSVLVENDLCINDRGEALGPPPPATAAQHLPKPAGNITTITPTTNAPIGREQLDDKQPPAGTPAAPAPPLLSQPTPAMQSAPSTPAAACPTSRLEAPTDTCSVPASAPAAAASQAAFSEVFHNTRPICRPWRSTPLLPLATCPAPSISTRDHKLTISLSHPTLTALSALCCGAAALPQLLLTSYLFSQARLIFRRQAFTIFQAARCANKVIASKTDGFPSQLAAYMLHAHAQGRADSTTTAFRVPLSNSSSVHPITPFHRSPLCSKLMSGSFGVYMVVAFLSWAMAVMLAYALFTCMYEVVGVGGAWFGLRIHSEGCHVMRTAPLISSRWCCLRKWLRAALGCSPEQEIREPIVEAKVVATQVKGLTMHRHIELHTATQIHRLDDPAKHLGQATMELVVAVINAHLRKSLTRAKEGRPCQPAIDHMNRDAGRLGVALKPPAPTLPAHDMHASVAAESLASVFTPIQPNPSACTPAGLAAESHMLGRPLCELKAQQAAAVRAVNYERADGVWTSTAAPQRASANIQLLSRSPGTLHMRIVSHSDRWLSGCVIALAPVSPLLAVLLSFVVSTLAPPLRALRLAPFCGAVAAALALALLFLKGWEVVDVRVSSGGFSIVRVPWWLPVPRAVALARWWPSWTSNQGESRQLMGAEVTVGEGLKGRQDVAVCLHVLPRRRSSAGTAHQYYSCQPQAVTIMAAEDPGAETPAFSVQDKLFVAAHINACMAELHWQELPAVPGPLGADDAERQDAANACLGV